jgi:hypothetical protein
MVELLQGLIQDDQRRERDERSTPQLAPFQPRDQDTTEQQG